MSPVLEVSDVRAGYGGADVLRDVSLTVASGQMVALVGANGAGKTTTLHVISGVMRPSAGRVTVLGARGGRPTPSSLVRAGLVLVPEGRHVFGPMSVENNLRLGAYLQPAAEIARTRDYVLELFPRLRERLSQAAGTMSGGEQQMVAIGRALMAKPRILLLDEPTLGLAPLVVDLIAEALRRLKAEGLSILIVEQNAFVALGLSDYAYLMENGAITAAGTPAELAQDDRVRAAYLGGTTVAQREEVGVARSASPAVSAH